MTAPPIWSCMPFLYPCLASRPLQLRPVTALKPRIWRPVRPTPQGARRNITTVSRHSERRSTPSADQVETIRDAHLNPSPDSYSSTPFTDRCSLTLHAGAGGHGCISFLREKFVPHGPANGGDGGTGGSVYIQAVRGETSLNRLSRTGILRAGRGRNGQGKNKGGERGKDVVIQVPVGTVLRELDRYDPAIDAAQEYKRSRMYGADASEPTSSDKPDQTHKWRRDKWLLYPGMLPSSYTTVEFPALPRPRRSNLSMAQPSAPLRLDLDEPMDKPMLLAAGAVGGLGNPHFVTKSITRPKFATKGEDAIKLQVHLELKILADVGLVGMPNAGKSTLLRSISNSRTRVGDWAFTTLQPNIGTVVVDDHTGRPSHPVRRHQGEPRASFTVADIPGLIQGAHLDKGLGLGFLRHIERAAALAFVIDLSAGDGVAALKALWNEIAQYQSLRERSLNMDSERRMDSQAGLATFDSTASMPRLESGEVEDADDQDSPFPDLMTRPQRDNKSRRIDDTDGTAGITQSIASKPWFVVATKADVLDTQPNFTRLQEYVRGVAAGELDHPSGEQNAWRKDISTVPVSAISGQGVERIPGLVMQMLDGR